MKTFKSDVTVNTYLDGVFQNTRVEKNRTIYEKKDGSFHINWVYGKRQIECKDGAYVYNWQMKTIKAMSIVDLIKSFNEKDL